MQERRQDRSLAMTMKGLLPCAVLFGAVMAVAAGGIPSPRETPIGSVTTQHFRLDVYADCTAVLVDATTGRSGTPTKFAGVFATS